jgi:hydrogenase maturation protease
MTENGEQRVLVIGYGNPARGDDGLGPEAAADVESRAIPGVTVDADYQLTVEDSAAVAEHDTVVFIDAAVEGEEPFAFYPLEPAPVAGVSTHGVEPDSVLGLARDLFGATTSAYVLAIRGYEFDHFTEALSDRARENLEAALAFIVPHLTEMTVNDATRSDVP